jgi:putative zinc finger/helix-turn-helix YgiT family protein
MTPERKAKPFPWRCPKCLAREVRPATIEHTSQVKHDGRLHEVTVPELVVPKCHHCGELVFCNDTEEQISRALREKLGLFQPDKIQAEREALGLTQKALAKLIRVAPETISRWESGLMIQSRGMNSLLKVFFECPSARAALGVPVEGGADLVDAATNWLTTPLALGSRWLTTPFTPGICAPPTWIMPPVKSETHMAEAHAPQQRPVHAERMAA